MKTSLKMVSARLPSTLLARMERVRVTQRPRPSKAAFLAFLLERGLEAAK